MSTVTKSFTAVGNGDVFQLRAGERATYSVSGTFSATLVLEKAVKAGAAWAQANPMRNAPLFCILTWASL